MSCAQPIGGWNPEYSSRRVGSLVRTDALQFSPQPSPRLLPASSPPPGEMRPYGVRSPALLLAQGIGGDAQALHKFADRIPQIYPSLSPACDTNCFRSRIALFRDTKAQTISFSSAQLVRSSSTARSAKISRWRKSF